MELSESISEHIYSLTFFDLMHPSEILLLKVGHLDLLFTLLDLSHNQGCQISYVLHSFGLNLLEVICVIRPFCEYPKLVG